MMPFIIPATLSPNPNPMQRPAGRAIPTAFALGTVYHFQNAGDVLPLHTHPRGAHCHISVILAGSFEYTEGPKTRIVSQSDHEIIDVPSGAVHGFRALEAGSLVLNLRKPVSGSPFNGTRPAIPHAARISNPPNHAKPDPVSGT